MHRLLAGWLLAAVVALGACAGDGPPAAPPGDEGENTVPVSIRLIGTSDFSATASTSVAPMVFEVMGPRGPLSGQVVTFSATGGGWLPAPRRATDHAGRVEVQWFLGPDPAATQFFTATAGVLQATYVAEILRPVPGSTYSGNQSFVQWFAGELPIVIAAPHGGTLTPVDIPDRTVGTTVRDTDTIELAMAITDAFESRTGMRPHVIICNLSRRKLDANREIVEAAAGAPDAEQAWREYHAAIEAAMIESRTRGGRSLFIDLHGHGHAAQRLELGYLLSSSRLELSDDLLELHFSRTGSSIWPLSAASGEPFTEVLRGPGSLGALLADHGFPSVPSPQFPDPGGLPYFDGGYSTSRHGVNAAGWAAGLQIEANYAGVRDSPASRAAFGLALVTALEAYLPRYGWPFTPLGVALGAAAGGRISWPPYGTRRCPTSVFPGIPRAASATSSLCS